MNAPQVHPVSYVDWRLSYVASTDSTNVQLLAAVDNGRANPGDVLIATQQTAGRGRQGRQWLSPSGGLYLSAIIEDHEAWRPIWALVTGLAVQQAITKLMSAQDTGVKLKWPNDVMVNDRKLAGILIERAGQHAPWWLVLGVGVNITIPTTRNPDISYLQDVISGVGTNEFAGFLLDAMSDLRRTFASGGIPLIRQAWLANAWRLGGPVSCHVDGTRLQGTFRDLDSDGAMLLELGNGAVRRITGGEVHFGTDGEAG